MRPLHLSHHRCCPIPSGLHVPPEISKVRGYFVSNLRSVFDFGPPPTTVPSQKSTTPSLDFTDYPPGNNCLFTSASSKMFVGLGFDQTPKHDVPRMTYIRFPCAKYDIVHVRTLDRLIERPISIIAVLRTIFYRLPNPYPLLEHRRFYYSFLGNG
mmetsp:Transcript_18871/g.43152  ORF Transcript_18871/g.43152 Transcript_18871/m.43152 type:complete len:155 (-) Transcript_18871:357-821(-)